MVSAEGIGGSFGIWDTRLDRRSSVASLPSQMLQWSEMMLRQLVRSCTCGSGRLARGFNATASSLSSARRYAGEQERRPNSANTKPLLYIGKSQIFVISLKTTRYSFPSPPLPPPPKNRLCTNPNQMMLGVAQARPFLVRLKGDAASTADTWHRANVAHSSVLPPGKM